MTGSRWRPLADALSVTWTSSLEAATKERIDHLVTVRRLRRKQAIRTAAILLTLCAGGMVFAFARSTEEPHPGPGPARPTATRPGPPPAPVPERSAAPLAAGATPSSSSPNASLKGAADEPADRAPADPGRAPAHRRVVAKAARPSAAGPPEDPVEARFAAADRARLAGHANDALRPLKEIQDLWPADRRAAVAAFQMGRILADELRDPAAAARAFDCARALAPDGPLAADARARADEARRAAATVPNKPGAR
jgi:hypothetical protein